MIFHSPTSNTDAESAFNTVPQKQDAAASQNLQFSNLMGHFWHFPPDCFPAFPVTLESPGNSLFSRISRSAEPAWGKWAAATAWEEATEGRACISEVWASKIIFLISKQFWKEKTGFLFFFSLHFLFDYKEHKKACFTDTFPGMTVTWRNCGLT